MVRMDVMRITPRGYCHGVVDAFRIAKQVRESTGGPVYMLGQLVHNTHATDELQEQGVEGEAPGRVHLVQDLEDVERLEIGNPRVALTCQTTLSMWDTEAMIEAVSARYPDVEVHNEICRATQERQEAAVAAAAEVDL